MQSLFHPHRERVLYPIALAGSAVVAPLAAYHFAAGNVRLAAVLACIVAVLAIDSAAMRLGRRPPIPFPLLLVPGAVAVGLSLLTQGIYGVLWAYPMALFAFFALPRTYANVTALSFGGFIATLVDLHMGGGIALRFALSLALCLVVLNVVMGVLEAQHARLLRHSITDGLTGAYNRRHMQACLQAAIERHARTDSPSSLILVDIDRFKSINDRFGHAAGDRALCAVVDCVRARCRRLDQLFRMGGEEFVLLLPDTASLEAAGLAEDLRRAIATTAILEGRAVTASMGVSQVRPGDSVDAWLKRVDEALYEAKENGRDRVLTTSTRLPARLPPRVPAAYKLDH